MMSNEREYLDKMRQSFKELAYVIGTLDEKDPNLLGELLKIVTQAKELEVQARKDFSIGARFSVIETQLQGLEKTCEKIIDESVGVDEREVTDSNALAENEMVIYIYLFNAQGGRASAWKPLLTPKALIDHSVNRPIYANESYIKELIRGKEVPDQHAYVIATIRKEDLLMSEKDSILQDKLGHPIIRIKHGALKPGAVREFCHRDKVYKREKEGIFNFSNNAAENEA